MAQNSIQPKGLSRRRFLHGSLAASGAVALETSPSLARAAAAVPKRTAVDRVTLGKTGIRLSRLGMGTGSNSGKVQFDLGRESFNGLVRYAYDQGITWFDCSETYRTFGWMAGALKGVAPRKGLSAVEDSGAAGGRAQGH